MPVQDTSAWATLGCTAPTRSRAQLAATEPKLKERKSATAFQGEKKGRIHIGCLVHQPHEANGHGRDCLGDTETSRLALVIGHTAGRRTSPSQDKPCRLRWPDLQWPGAAGGRSPSDQASWSLLGLSFKAQAMAGPRQLVKSGQTLGFWVPKGQKWPCHVTARCQDTALGQGPSRP